MPRQTKPKLEAGAFYYTYVLYSQKDHKLYKGFTSDLKNRIKEHNQGNVTSTAYRRPLILIYYEAGLSREDSSRREKYLKSTAGSRFIAKRLRDYLYL
ncbi:MAG: GIY-YIG nuclease family protein [Patescibacteria group bacterium]